MTEAMSRREIEDVLSSIRRLVSQDQPRQDQSAPEQGGAAAPGKLILTSELRVPDDLPDPDSESPAAEAGVDAGDTDLGQDADQGENAGALPPSEDAPSASADGPSVTKDAPSAIHMLRAMNLRDSDQKTATTAAQGDDTAPSDNAPSDNAGLLADAQTAPDADGDLVLEATLARLEKVLAQQKTQPPSEDAATQSTTPDAPDAEASDLPELHRDAALPDDPVIDEAMLYQIVANIVRQELQGELGERITRNIRKLVRAEVARELQLRKP